MYVYVEHRGKKYFFISMPRGYNFYPIDTKFSIQIGLVKSKFDFVDGLCRFNRGLWETTQKINKFE